MRRWKNKLKKVDNWLKNLNKMNNNKKNKMIKNFNYIGNREQKRLKR